MTLAAEVGAGAPNFDLASTEGVVIMLRDEVPRSGVVLYLFGKDVDPSVESDLKALHSHYEGFVESSCRVFALSPLPLKGLKDLQERLGLAFPLLHDDRDFLAAYGVDKEGGSRGLFLVDRDEKLAWLDRPLESVELSAQDLLAQIGALSRSTSNYPRSILNGLIDRLRG